MDFTLKKYKMLLKTLSDQGFSFMTFGEYMADKSRQGIILRHDVDRLPGNSLAFAKIQAEAGLRGTYFFRVVPESFEPGIIRQISGLGHEVGYHYEDFVLASKKVKVKSKKLKSSEEIESKIASIAIKEFERNLNRLRDIGPVNTICMHGSPMSRWDSRLLWKYYDYHEFGLTGEPYFDVNFNEILYLTDTGRRWDGSSISIRDKVAHEFHPLPSFKLHSTSDIVMAAEKGILPGTIMMTFHPQRWTDRALPWLSELCTQNIKNVLKYIIIRTTKTRTSVSGLS